jgi:NAD(P)-dependent dehydrogenase (short-subunit alcohol dehydrogenase family)
MSRIFASQFVALPYPSKKFTGQTVIVTGSNVGLGLEAARHLVRLDAAKVILAVRNVSKGEAAAKSITESTGRPGVTDVWEVDFSRYDSVKAFAQRAQALERLDVVIANAGIYNTKFEVAEDNEATITVNAINTLFLGILLLPKLRETALKLGKPSVLTFTGSFVHFLTPFPERHFDNILQGLSVPEKARMDDR